MFPSGGRRDLHKGLEYNRKSLLPGWGSLDCFESSGQRNIQWNMTGWCHCDVTKTSEQCHCWQGVKNSHSGHDKPDRHHHYRCRVSVSSHSEAFWHHSRLPTADSQLIGQLCAGEDGPLWLRSVFTGWRSWQQMFDRLYRQLWTVWLIFWTFVGPAAHSVLLSTYFWPCSLSVFAEELKNNKWYSLVLQERVRKDNVDLYQGLEWVLKLRINQVLDLNMKLMLLDLDLNLDFKPYLDLDPLLDVDSNVHLHLDFGVRPNTWPGAGWFSICTWTRAWMWPLKFTGCCWWISVSSVSSSCDVNWHTVSSIMKTTSQRIFNNSSVMVLFNYRRCSGATSESPTVPLGTHLKQRHWSVNAHRL